MAFFLRGFHEVLCGGVYSEKFLEESHAYVANTSRRNGNLEVLALYQFDDLTDRKAVYRTYRCKRIRRLCCAHSGGGDQDEPQGLLRQRDCDGFVRL